MGNRRRVALAAVALVAAAGCSSTSTNDAATTTTGATTESTGGPAGSTAPGSTVGSAPAGTTPGTAVGGCPGETELTVTGAGSGTETGAVDGPLDIETQFADIAFGDSGSLVFATYEIPDDPQFGQMAPVGVPEVPEGGVIFQVSLAVTGGEELAPGEYPDDDAAPARINFISMYAGSTRINPLGDHTVTITAIDEDSVCGTITGVGETSLQSFPVVQGTFDLPIV